jgi:hypothetical protein
VRGAPAISTRRPPRRSIVPAPRALEHREGRAAAHPAQPAEGEAKPRGVREASLHVRGEAVAGHDVEAGAGEEHDAHGLRVEVAIRDRLEDRDLAGDVDVVDSGGEAGVHHRLRGRGETARRRAARPTFRGSRRRCRQVRRDRTRGARGSAVSRAPRRRHGFGRPGSDSVPKPPRARPPSGRCSRWRRRSGRGPPRPRLPSAPP